MDILSAKTSLSYEENDRLRQVAEDIVAGKRRMPMAHIDRNALVRNGKDARSGIYGMHKIHHPSCYIPEFLARVRDPRLTEPDRSARRYSWPRHSGHQQPLYLESSRNRLGLPLAPRQILLWQAVQNSNDRWHLDGNRPSRSRKRVPIRDSRQSQTGPFHTRRHCGVAAKRIQTGPRCPRRGRHCRGSSARCGHLVSLSPVAQKHQ